MKQNEIEKIIHADITTGKRKILIIEDNALNREMLCEILKDKYDILTAENGEIGFEILEKNYKALSVILLDMQMPVCDGTEFLKKIGEDTALASIPVIVITANSDEDAELTCLNLGASDFIRKPYNADIIKGRVDNVIKLKESTLMLAAVEHDELTGLYTRQVFLHYAKGIMKFRADTPMH
ncbi:MAG: response regulator, partial [Coprococcus sp.]